MFWNSKPCCNESISSYCPCTLLDFPSTGRRGAHPKSDFVRTSEEYPESRHLTILGEDPPPTPRCAELATFFATSIPRCKREYCLFCSFTFSVLVSGPIMFKSKLWTHVNLAFASRLGRSVYSIAIYHSKCKSETRVSWVFGHISPNGQGLHAVWCWQLNKPDRTTTRTTGTPTPSSIHN